MKHVIHHRCKSQRLQMKNLVLFNLPVHTDDTHCCKAFQRGSPRQPVLQRGTRFPLKCRPRWFSKISSPCSCPFSGRCRSRCVNSALVYNSISKYQNIINNNVRSVVDWFSKGIQKMSTERRPTRELIRVRSVSLWTSSMKYFLSMPQHHCWNDDVVCAVEVKLLS